MFEDVVILLPNKAPLMLLIFYLNISYSSNDQFRMDPDHDYSPSRWSLRGNADEVIKYHIETVTRASNEAKATVPCSLDVPYGTKEGEKMDIYGLDLPKDAPVAVYIHGGYWQDLNRPMSAYPVIPLYKAGCVSIIIGYDLAPKVTLAEIVAEIRTAMVKVLDFALERGSRSVAVAGHSAGAHLAAMLFTKNWISEQGEKAQLIKGVLYISGVYDLKPLLDTYVNAALSLDSAAAEELSPILQLEKNELNQKIRHVVVVGEFDPPTFKDQSKLFFDLLQDKDYITEFKVISSVDHFDIVENLAKDEYELTKTFRELSSL